MVWHGDANCGQTHINNIITWASHLFLKQCAVIASIECQMTRQRSFYALATARPSTKPRLCLRIRKKNNKRARSGNDNGHYHRNCHSRTRIIADSRNEVCASTCERWTPKEFSKASKLKIVKRMSIINRKTAYFLNTFADSIPG